MLLVQNKSIVFYIGLFLIVFSFQCNDKLKTGKVTSTDNSTIEFLQSGHGDTTLLFIHGWCINKEYWLNQIQYFSGRYTVVAIDLPGFGASSKDRTNWNFEQYALDIKSCIDQLHLKNVILIGHSMSGDIVLKVENMYPQSIVGIIGVDNLHTANGPQDSASQSQSEAYFDEMSSHFDSAVIQGAKPYLFQPSTPEPVIERVMSDILKTDPKIAVGVLRALNFIAQTEKVMMKDLQHGLALVNSDAQPVYVDSLNAYCAKGVKVYPIPSTGHYPMIEKPDAFNIALQQAIWNQ